MTPELATITGTVMAKKRIDEDSSGPDPDRPVSIRLPQDMHDRLSETARALGVKLSVLIRMMVTRYLPVYEQEADKIRRANTRRN